MAKKKDIKGSSVARGTSLSSLSRLRKSNLDSIKTSSTSEDHSVYEVEDFPKIEKRRLENDSFNDLEESGYPPVKKGKKGRHYSSIDHIEYLDRETNLKDIVNKKSRRHKEKREQNNIETLNTELSPDDYKLDDFDIRDELENFSLITEEDESPEVPETMAEPVDFAEISEPVDFEETVEPTDFEETVEPTDFEETVEPTDFEETVEPTDFEEAVEPSDFEETVEPTDFEETVEPTDFEETVEPTDFEETVEPSDFEETVEPTDFEEAVEPTDFEETVEPTDFEEAVEPTDFEETVEPSDFEEAVEPTDFEETVEPSDFEEAVEPTDFEEAAEPTDFEETVEPTDFEETVEPSDFEEAAEPTDFEEAVEPTDFEEAVEPTEFEEAAEPVQFAAAAETETLEELEELEELSEPDLIEELDELSYLTDNIDDEGIKAPVKVGLNELDPSITNNILDYKVKAGPVESEDELFGVKKTEVFYKIDKEIYSKRAKTSLDLSKVKNIKSGMTLPITVAVFLIMFIPIVYTFAYFYFQNDEKATLQDNVIKDNSIQGKLREKQQERYEAEKKKLEAMLRANELRMQQFESTVEEELKRSRVEIENEYKEKLASLTNQGYSQAERERLIKELEEEKMKALLAAENKKDQRIREQNLLIEQEKNRLLVERDEIQEKEKELEELLKNRQLQLEEQERLLSLERERVSEESKERQRQLEELSRKNREIQEFNETVLNLITGGIEEFGKNNKDEGIKKLLSVLEYYDAREEFVLSTPELLAKRQADTFFIETISNLVAESKNSPLYSQEFINTIEKFKDISLYYRNAELYYSQNELTKAQAEYLKVLNEFDEVNNSYQKIRLIERQVQNIKASNLYNQAVEQMKAGNYNQALSLLERVVTETPESEFSSPALENITQLASLISRDSESESDKMAEQEAKALFESARRLEGENNYSQAIESYRKVILDYPASSYTREALTRAILLKEKELGTTTETAPPDSREVTDFAAALTSKFRESYDKFLTSYEQGNLEEARTHYFTALTNAFNSYSDNSIARFRTFEDEYFEKMINEQSALSRAAFEKELEESKSSITEKYEKLLADEKASFTAQLESERARLEDEKAAIEERYSKLLSEKTSEDVSEAIKSYEEQISSQKEEIARLTRIKEDYEKQLSESGDSSKEELARLKTEYEEQISTLNNELSRLSREKTELEQALTEKGSLSDNQIATLKANYENQINELNSKVDQLEKLKTDYETQLSGAEKSTDEQIVALKKSYDSRILSLNSEITQLKSEQKAASTKYADYDERLSTLQSSYSNKQSELEEEKQFTISLKQQLADLYTKYEEIQAISELPVDEDKSELVSKISELEKKYRDLEKLYEKARFSEDEIRAEIEKQLKEEYDRKVILEVDKVKTEFAQELDKIKNVKVIEEELAAKEEDGTEETTEKVFQNKIIARISEIIDDSVAYQYLSTKLVTELEKGDTVKIIRYQAGKEIVIGHMTITYTSSTSLFGRGRITSLENGQSARANDILKN